MTEDNDRTEGHGTPENESQFSFTDKRKVDPTDGSVRPSAAESAGVDPVDAEAAQLFEQAAAGETGDAPAGEEGGRVAELETQVADLNEELKRAQAEYVNSRRRIEASAAANAEAAKTGVLGQLIGVLDDVELGRQHGDIVEGTPFHAIATKLEDAVRAQGMERFGAVGEEFDPNLHEALMHEDSEEATSTTISVVMQPGYSVGGRVLRPARVGTRGPQ